MCIRDRLTTDEVQSVEPGQTVTMNMYTMDGSELPLTGVVDSVSPEPSQKMCIRDSSMDVCPKCGSRNLTKIERMNGYLSYSRVKGDTRPVSYTHLL